MQASASANQPSNLLSSSGAEGTADTSAADLASAVPLFRCGDIVIVRPLRAQLWLAQLLEAVIETSPGCFNVDRPRCRYFVPTTELGAYEHALAWWAERGEPLRLCDAEAALARAASSAGVHFSFEKLDHVTRSTICRALPAGCLSEKSWSRGYLSCIA